MRFLLRLVPIGAVGLAAFASAQSSVTHVVDVPTQSWSSFARESEVIYRFTIPRFNASLGTLKAIRIQVSGRGFQQGWIGSNGASSEVRSQIGEGWASAGVYAAGGFGGGGYFPFGAQLLTQSFSAVYAPGEVKRWELFNRFRYVSRIESDNAGPFWGELREAFVGPGTVSMDFRAGSRWPPSDELGFFQSRNRMSLGRVTVTYVYY